MKTTKNHQGAGAWRTGWPVILIGLLLYMVIVVFIGRSSVAGESYRLLGKTLANSPINGIMTQIQMLILVFMVLQLDWRGYWTAMALNALSLILAGSYMLRMKSIAVLPGIISYAGVFLILTLIYLFRRKINAYMKEIDKQQKELMISESLHKKMAYTDGLTGLPNRNFFIESLTRDISLSIRNETLLSVIYIDLDSFKSINDTLGHKAGDEALIEVSKRITSVMRNEDILSRFGGDEFLMLAGNIQSIDDVNIIAEKLLSVFREPLIIKDMEFFTTASIGISVFPYDGRNAEQLIKNGDMAMYLAKKQGKNRYTFCTQEMKKDSMRKLSLTNRLYRALENGELYVLYQPQLRVGTREIVGFEALLRWNNSQYGLVSPGEFIPMAEQTGLIKPIGLWVFREACLQYRTWKEKCLRDIRMSVNMSVEQLKDDSIIKQVKNVLDDTGVSADHLEIEVTEGAAFSDTYNIIDKLTALREMGFQIAIDDFGKEYSSLNRIRTFPVDRLKIDMDFVHGISTGDIKDRAVVKTIIQLGNNLGVHVIAEGVENREQYEFLEHESCDEVQGFLFFKGMSPKEIAPLLDCQE